LQRRRGGGGVTAGYIFRAGTGKKTGEKVCGGKVSENPHGNGWERWGTDEEERRSSSTVSGGCDRAGCGRACAVARYRRDRAAQNGEATRVVVPARRGGANRLQPVAVLLDE
jgi:hypothetical protein